MLFLKISEIFVVFLLFAVAKTNAKQALSFSCSDPQKSQFAPSAATTEELQLSFQPLVPIPNIATLLVIVEGGASNSRAKNYPSTLLLPIPDIA